MSADEVTHGADADASRVRTGPRHAAPRKPLLARIHLPAGKAIALAAMPTAVLMGMGFTPTLARADDQPTSKSLTAEEYEACVDAMTAEASASASPSASETSSDTKDDSTSDTKDTTSKDTTSKDDDSASDGSSSSDSGSDDTAEPSPSASSQAATSSDTSSSDDTATASPSATETSKSVLETIGDAIKDVFDGDSTDDATATASPSPSASASESAAADGTDTSSDSSGATKETTEKTTGTVKDAASEAADAAADASDTATEAAASADASASASPSPSASATTDVDDCPVATDDVSGVDNKLPLPDDPWYLNASSLLLKSADYQGIVKVKTAGGKTKEVLKYVISGGTDIGDLHQTVIDKQAGKTYHVQAGKGTTSTIKGGDTVMYTESISGNLFGLIPVTFTPENPPPLNIPLIYFTNVKVQQAGQFGGTLTVPGLHQYTT
ncbi:hypothetical protein ABZ490_34920 [Streptomyces sp. NPDC005811]|uniref:hypothetical protein n=1 Tax=Streptomyces sp. NPDC005811 TaxID=3154565 RepID=UPI0033EB3EB8